MSDNPLKNIQLFSDFSAGELDDLLAIVQKRTYPRGSIVLHKGDRGDMLYFILKGKVKVVLIHRAGREIILNLLKSGDYFGEMSVFDHMPRSATIIAEDDSEFLIVSREAITEQIRRNPQISLKMLSGMSNRVREMNEQVFSLTNLDAKGRVAQALMKLLKKEDVRVEEGCKAIPRPLLKDIAAMSGTSRETVSRTMAELTKSGAIGQRKDCIIIYEELDLED